MGDRFPSRCLLPNPPCFERGRWSDIDALCANFAQLGESIDYDAVVSAVAASALFDFHYSECWFDDAAVSACSGDVLGEACEALGYTHSWRAGESFAATWQVLQERIAGGEPVVAGGIIPGEEPGTCYCAHFALVVGYDASGDTRQVAVVGWEPRGVVTWTPLPSLRGEPESWHARVRSLAVAPDVWAQRPLLIIEGKSGKSKLGTDELARRNLQRCVEYATSREGPAGHWRLWPGIRGMQAWAGDIGEYEAAIERESPEERGFPLTNISLGLSQCFELRRTAFARYLRDVRHLFGRNAKTSLTEAAQHCEKQVTLMASFRELLFGVSGPWDERQEIGKRNLSDASVRANAAAILRQVVDEEEALVEGLALLWRPSRRRAVRRLGVRL